ncbi:MAG: choice-of-anchor Q domain-containing protein [Bacteroidota bacterium]
MKSKIAVLFIALLLIGSRCSKNEGENVEVTFTCDQCDYIVSGYKTDGVELEIKAGQVICLDASVAYEKVLFTNINGTADKPIIIRNCGGIAKISSPKDFGIKFEDSKNFKLLGDGTGGAYGIRVTTRGGFFISMEHFTTDFEIAQVEVAGPNGRGLGDDAGFAGMGIKTSPYQDCNLFKDASRTAWVMRNISIHNNWVHDTGGEGLYIGHGFYIGRKEAECPDVTYSHSIKGIRVYDNLIEATGYDGIQVKNTDSDCQIYNNVIRNFGNRGENGQNEGLFLGEGVTGKVYNNFIDRGTGNGIKFQAMGNNDIFNNVILNAGRDGINCSGSQYGVYIPNGYFKFFNNTIYNSAEKGFAFYNNDGGVKMIMNNLIVKADELFPKGATIEESNNIMTNDIGSIKFADPGRSNLILNSGSPCINTGIDVRIFNPGLTFDIRNEARPKGAAFDVGAYEIE